MCTPEGSVAVALVLVQNIFAYGLHTFILRNLISCLEEKVLLKVMLPSNCRPKVDRIRSVKNV